jgi:uncharacterized protein YjbI with pentapeptide repeats
VLHHPDDAGAEVGHREDEGFGSKQPEVLVEDADWRGRFRGGGPLAGAAFLRCDFSRVDLSGVTLPDARFEDCDFGGAQFESEPSATISISYPQPLAILLLT